MSDTVPVAYFAYRRPDLVERSLASLRANQVPLLYAFSDGPREPGLAPDVAAVRQRLRAVDWTTMVLVEHQRNMGVSAVVLGGVTRVLEEHDRLIVCEEDLEFMPGTYAWLCAALAYYADDPRVMGVAAWNHPRVTPANVTTDPYFSGRTTSLLWGTWRRAWDGVMDTTCAELCDLCAARGIDVTEYGDDIRNAAIHEQQYGMWDHRFNLHVLAQGGVFLWPARSMVAHLGYDPRATNSPNGTGWEDTPSPAPPPASVRWPDVRIHPESAALWCRAVNAPLPPSLLARVRRRLRRFWAG